jgi:hypothetical protein
MSCRADVIKIEHPTRGDDTRAWGPPYAKYTQGEHSDGPGESAYYLAVSHCRSQFVRDLTSTGKSQQTVSGPILRSSVRRRHIAPLGKRMRCARRKLFAWFARKICDGLRYRLQDQPRAHLRKQALIGIGQDTM